MPIDFPSSPSTNDTYTYNGRSWTYDGAAWQATGPDNSFLVPTGTILPYSGISTPSGYLLCDGSAVSRSTYATLFSAVTASKGTFTVTIASPGVITLNSHGFTGGEAIYLTTTGALPTNLTANTTTYYVLSASLTANTFRVATSRGGTAINTSGSQSGTHTLYHAPYGVSSSTTFLLPDLRGRAPFGKDNLGGTAASRITQATSGVWGQVIGGPGGDERLHQHTHTGPGSGGNVSGPDTSIGWANSAGGSGWNPATLWGALGNAGAGGSQNMPPALILNYMVKT